MDTGPRCAVRDCKQRALPDAVAKVRVENQDLTFRVCELHREILSRGSLYGVSAVIEPRPARPKEESDV